MIPFLDFSSCVIPETPLFYRTSLTKCPKCQKILLSASYGKINLVSIPAHTSQIFLKNGLKGSLQPTPVLPLRIQPQDPFCLFIAIITALPSLCLILAQSWSAACNIAYWDQQTHLSGAHVT